MTSQKSDLIIKVFQLLLEENNTNAYQISKEKDLDRAYLSKFFSGVIAKPGTTKLAKIAQSLNIELGQLQLILDHPEIAVKELNLDRVKLDLSQKSSSKHDWGAAPDGIVCYERKSEIDHIKQLIKIDRCRAMTIFGLGGIGKTTIAMEVARQMEIEVDYVFWRTLANLSLGEILVQDALRLFTNKKPQATISQQITDLIHYLREHRCLLILDQVETILATGNSAQVYQNGCEIYGELFKQIAQTQHQSCLMIVSNEKPRDISILESCSASIYSLQLRGSRSVCYEILKDRGIIQTPAWDELIEAYHEHPLAIKIVGSIIEELFAGDVSEFLRQNTLFLGDLEFVLHEQYHRLADEEKYLINIIAQINQPLSLQELVEQYATQLRCSEIINCLNNLKRRSLLEIVAYDQSLHQGTSSTSETKTSKINFYTIQPIVRKYITSQI